VTHSGKLDVGVKLNGVYKKTRRFISQSQKGKAANKELLQGENRSDYHHQMDSDIGKTEGKGHSEVKNSCSRDSRGQCLAIDGQV